MVDVFHGTNQVTHDQFQEWRRRHPDGFHMTEGAAGVFTIHYAQDKRENGGGRGCHHQGVSSIAYLEDGESCYTTARKVCSVDFAALLDWAASHGVRTKNCKHCDTTRFPFPADFPGP